MPVGDVLVGDTGSHIEHDNTALAIDIVPISETTELLLTSSVPHVELDSSAVLPTQLVGVNRRGEAVGAGFFSVLAGHGHTVVKVRGCTSTPRVAMYFFSNSPVR